MLSRQMMLKSARRLIVVPMSVAFVLLAPMTESSAAPDKAYRWIGDPRLATDISAARRQHRHAPPPARATLLVPLRASPLMQSDAASPGGYGYGVGDNSRNMTW